MSAAAEVQTTTIDGHEFRLYHRSQNRSTTIWNRDGIDWADAPKPRRLHRCFVQTRGYLRYFTCVDRCACGAIRHDGGRWAERNSR